MMYCSSNSLEKREADSVVELMKVNDAVLIVNSVPSVKSKDDDVVVVNNRLSGRCKRTKQVVRNEELLHDQKIRKQSSKFQLQMARDTRQIQIDQDYQENMNSFKIADLQATNENKRKISFMNFQTRCQVQLMEATFRQLMVSLQYMIITITIVALMVLFMAN